jgi:hypothetical protein
VQLGWRLAIRGQFDEGIPVLKRAVARSANPPGWYFHLIAIDLMLKGEFKHMLGMSQHSAVDGSLISQSLIAVAAGALFRPDIAQPALQKMAQTPAFNKDPGTAFRKHGATREIFTVVERGLENARSGTCEQTSRLH